MDQESHKDNMNLVRRLVQQTFYLRGFDFVFQTTYIKYSPEILILCFFIHTTIWKFGSNNSQDGLKLGNKLLKLKRSTFRIKLSKYFQLMSPLKQGVNVLGN